MLSIEIGVKVPMYGTLMRNESNQLDEHNFVKFLCQTKSDPVSQPYSGSPVSNPSPVFFYPDPKPA